MENINIPIYRGKKIDSDEWVEGDYCSKTKRIITDSLLSWEIVNKESGYFKFYNYDYFEIEPKTLSIHFPDMIASDSDRLLPNGEKDLRIFASLSEDSKGGDILDDGIFKKVCKYDRIKGVLGFLINPNNKKITGIKQ